MSADTPAWLECWKSLEEKKRSQSNVETRDRWLNRPTFILASLGAAVGLGNFWRFPYLTYKYDGAAFFFPYVTCLLTMSVPLLLMELSLGQKFQRGDISVFRGIWPRFAGIGLASVFSAYIICFYYNVIISWAVVYLIAGFFSPLPWSKDVVGFEWKCDPDRQSRAEQFFSIDVIRFYNDECQPYVDGDPWQFSWYACLATFVVWALCFVAVSRGVHSSSYIVWCTVPVPLLFIIIMVIMNNTLPGSEVGIQQYLQGATMEQKMAGVAYDDLFLVGVLGQFQASEDAKLTIWADACGQIFFTIGVCMGIMTSYGSYNKIRKPIIMDNMIICFGNSLVSFIAGFAVWAIVGYLQGLDHIAKSKTSSAGLAFIAYPTAVDLMPASNFWAIILGATLFLLGVDSAFAMVEAASTVICDTPTGKKYPRLFVAFVLCFGGFVFSVPFCTNWGYVLFDVIDHYLCVFLLLLVGIFQCAGVGWAFDVANKCALSAGHKTAIKMLTASYWVSLTVWGVVFASLEMKMVGMLSFIPLLAVFLVASKFLSGLPWGTWFEEVMMCSVAKLAFAMSCLTREKGKQAVRRPWEYVYMVYWGLCIKYVIPVVLWFILVDSFKNDVLKAYGGYAWGW